MDDNRYGLPLAAVERAVPAVQITRLQRAPDIVLGVVNVQGRVVPVVDPRSRFRLPKRDSALTDHLVIAHTARRHVALISDATSGVLAYSADEAVAASLAKNGQ